MKYLRHNYYKFEVIYATAARIKLIKMGVYGAGT